MVVLAGAGAATAVAIDVGAATETDDKRKRAKVSIEVGANCPFKRALILFGKFLDCRYGNVTIVHCYCHSNCGVLLFLVVYCVYFAQPLNVAKIVLT